MYARQQKITIGEMRESGPTQFIVQLRGLQVTHPVVIDARSWPDEVCLSDPSSCSSARLVVHRSADVRPLFAVDKPSLRGAFRGKQFCAPSATAVHKEATPAPGLGAELGPPILAAGNAEKSAQRPSQTTATRLIGRN
jgi:hypothetical protein